MPNDNLKLAIKEAHASAPTNGVIYLTLEINHAAFKDELGNKVAIRVVNSNKILRARLEDTAPLDAGLDVDFQPYAFSLQFEPLDGRPLPEITLTIDNVHQDIEYYIRLANTQPSPMTIIYRQFLSEDLTQPQEYSPASLTINDIQITPQLVTAKAVVSSFANLSFPRDMIYTVEKFPGLAR